LISRLNFSIASLEIFPCPEFFLNMKARRPSISSS
jgi:hypothetical protein